MGVGGAGRRFAVLLGEVLALGLAACGPEQATNQATNPNAAAEIAKFLDSEIKDLSVLDRAGQEAELNWFATAAAPFQGMEINVVSESLSTHEYESRVLAPAFTAITGIKVTHELIGEGDVVDREVVFEGRESIELLDPGIGYVWQFVHEWPFMPSRSLAKA